jgi:hypothetical protein
MKKILFLSLLALGFALSFNSALAAAGSQCKTGQDSGEQNDCTHENDSAILSSQCAQKYSASSCSNMQSYLSAMSVECSQSNPSGIDCSMITQNGIYGREAAKFASYKESNTGGGGGNGGGGNAGSNCAFTSGWNISSLSCTLLPNAKISVIIKTVMLWLLFIFGFIGVIGFVISGIMYLTSAGEEDRAKTAKQAMFYSIIGIIVGLVGYIALQSIYWILSGYSNF